MNHFCRFGHITAMHLLNHYLHILGTETVFSEIAQITKKNKQDLRTILQFSLHLKLRAVPKVHHKRWSHAVFCYLSRGNELLKTDIHL
ncbi:hypothetical protein T4B_9555 [Trichinella pseudospiralis]|uniref:Uncharacterized protein n=1 Tax=Trichinella pseudospiralis TaxID=6337 RepID=A0A0V1IUY1_TRIPS|nr:hypothetical protein T4B_9555 [Trichinella pseudospiralis]KRZ33234.1 hypothetical protein T4C_9076 [Trichinella pseudospiralis]